MQSVFFLGTIVLFLLKFSCSADVFETIHEWKKLDFEYPTYVQRQRAIANRDFIPENNLPLGIERHEDRLFVTTPRWKDGVPASLNYIRYPSPERSPPLKPYPNWEEHGDPYQPDCNKLMSVYRTAVDVCGRLWLIDSGIVNATVLLNQVCPPKIVVYDLKTDQRLLKYELPPDQVKQDSLHSNIVVDVSSGKCDHAFAYVTDVWRYGIVVFSLAEQRSWRVMNYLFSPTPQSAAFDVYGLRFQWLDGVFGLSLSHEATETAKIHAGDDDADWQNLLYFHPMASFKEFYIQTRLLQNSSLAAAVSYELAHAVQEIGDRGERGQSSTSGITRNGIMFFTQVHRDNIGCWNTAKPYTSQNLAYLLEDNNKKIRFPNDLKIDREAKQSVWVMSNSLPIYLYSTLNFTEINFRILRAYTEEVIKGTVCEPKITKTYLPSINYELHQYL